MKSIKILSVSLVASLLAGVPAMAQEPATSMDELLRASQRGARTVSQKNQERLRRFETERNNQRALLRQARADRDAAQRHDG